MSSVQIPKQAMRLYDQSGHRLYVNAVERERFLVAARSADPHIRSFGLTLLYTGCRISEALALVSSDVQIDMGVVTFRTLKRRQDDVFREVPIPDELAGALLRTCHAHHQDQPIWQHRRAALNRSTGYRWIKWLMAKAQIEGVQASPNVLR